MTEERIHKLCDLYNIQDYTINNDMSIDVDNDVIISELELVYIPLKFNKVSGDFNCSNNNLITLKNTPTIIGEDFDCYDNKIRTFKYFPKEIYSGFVGMRFNPINELWQRFYDLEYIDYFNELDIIQNYGKTVILDRLNYFLQDLDKPEIKENSLKNYNIK